MTKHKAGDIVNVHGVDYELIPDVLAILCSSEGCLCNRCDLDVNIEKRRYYKILHCPFSVPFTWDCKLSEDKLILKELKHERRTK